MQISIHYILSFSNERYGRATSILQLTGPKKQPPYKEPVPEEYYYKGNTTLPPTRKANATFVFLGTQLNRPAPAWRV